MQTLHAGRHSSWNAGVREPSNGGAERCQLTRVIRICCEYKCQRRKEEYFKVKLKNITVVRKLITVIFRVFRIIS